MVPSGLQAEDGREIFNSLACGRCHKADIGRAKPSLKDIALSELRLLYYLNGEAESLFSPEKGDRMKRYVDKMKVLSDFILKHGACGLCSPSTDKTWDLPGPACPDTKIYIHGRQYIIAPTSVYPSKQYPWRNL